MAKLATSMPGINFQGTDDKSTRRPVGQPEAMPFHRPLFFHFGEKGPTDQQYMPSSQAPTLYGQKFLDPKTPFFTHASPFIQEAIDTTSRALHIRVLPEDVPNKSTLAVSVDYVLADIQQYERETSGVYKLSPQGALIPTNTVKGIRARFVVEQVPDDVDGASLFGRRQSAQGTIGDQATPSLRVPLFDVEARDYMDGTGIGFRLWAPTELDADPADKDAMDAAGAYLYKFGIVNRESPLSSATKERTYTYGYETVSVSFGKKVVNAATDSVYDIDKLVPKLWDTTDASDPQRCSLGRVHVYRDHLDTFLQAIHDAEETYGTVGETPATVNFLGGQSVEGVPYYAYHIDDLLDGGAEFTTSTTHYLQGGGTGTMTNDSFNKAVAAILSDLDGDYHFKNYARFPFNAFWDSGFDHKTKLLIPQLMANRYDSWICVVTQDIAEPDNTPEEDASYATALLTRIQQYPDSQIFNTPAFRGIIHGQAATWLGSEMDIRVPQALDLFYKVCRWGNDSTGKADEQWAPDAGAPDGDTENDNRVVRRTRDTSNVDVSARTKKAEWAAGIVYVEDYDTRSQFYAGIQSFYTDPTSVLRSGLVGLCVANINRYSWEGWRAFTGVQGITDDQLIERTERYVDQKCRACISTDRMIVEPHAEITAADDANGSSWTVRNDLYVSGMRTVLNASNVAYRRSDLNLSE